MRIVTHDSNFHADDIFAVASLLLKFRDAEVIRSRQQEILDSGDYVVDVGMIYDPAKHRFDHHMPKGAGVRTNGIPYAAFGLIWKELGEELAGGKQEADLIENKLVQPLDALDNGVAIAEYKYEGIAEYTLADLLFSYLPRSRQTPEELYKIFMQLVDIAKGLLVREIAKAKDTIASEKKVLEIYNNAPDKRVLVLPEELPWKRIIGEMPEVLFLVAPRNDGQWGLRTVEDERYVMRRPLPVAWGGKAGEELQKITGVSDAVFCHRALFMCSAKSKEGILKLAELALNA